MTELLMHERSGSAHAGRDTLLEVKDLSKHYELRGGRLGRTRQTLRAVDGVSFGLRAGETLGLVGESGSGKSTLARLMVGLARPTTGTILFDGRDIGACSRSELRDVRQHVQIVFQDPYTSLDPKMSVAEIVAEPLRAYGRYGKRRGRQRVHELLERVGISPDLASRRPGQFSGGQCQRIGIARALALDPRLIVLDEAVSALDVSVQAQVLNLLRDLQDEFGVAYLFISHDLSVVQHVAQRVAVMYLGKFVEVGKTESVYSAPAHPYTKALLSAVLDAPYRDRLGRERIVLSGDVPSPINPPPGCPFRSRCWKAQDACAVDSPSLETLGRDHAAACKFPLIGTAI